MSKYSGQCKYIFSRGTYGQRCCINRIHNAPLVLASIDPSCIFESTAAPLRTKRPNEHTWDYVATALLDEYNARIILSSRVSSSKNRVKIERKFKGRRSNPSEDLFDRKDSSDHDDSDIDRTVKAFSGALR